MTASSKSRFLDHPHAAAWQMIDRDRFERLTAPKANEAEQAAHFVGLYPAGTVLTFEEDLRTWTARWNGDATVTPRRALPRPLGYHQS